MSSKRLFVRITASFFAGLFAAATVVGQGEPVNAGQTLTQRAMPVAERNNLYCAGYVQTSPIETSMQLVGGREEQEQYIYSQNNVVYINAGSSSRLKEGDVLSVFRPRGKVSKKITDKEGSLGFYVQEIGAVEVIRVKPEYSVARIKASCDNFLLGDLVEPIPARTSPLFKDRPPLDLYADSNGKAVGRLFLNRDGAELIARDQIVYVDLGAEDNVRVGDYLSVFRPVGDGSLFMPSDSETGQASSYGYPSGHFNGSKFSNQSPRRRGEKAQKSTNSALDAKNERPEVIRKVVGELVILNVKERTATAVVVRTAQEILPGDFVQVQ